MKLKSSKEYLLNLQQMIEKRKEKVSLLYLKKDFKEDLEFEINNLNQEIEELDKRITTSTMK